MKASTPVPSAPVNPLVKLSLLGAIALSFVLAGLWRVSAGQDFSPGRISVATLLLSVALFVGLDLRTKFPLGGWVGVVALISFHQLATVHAEPFPEEGSDLLTLRGVGKELDSFDTAWDSTGNVIGAALALGWLMQKRPE